MTIEYAILGFLSWQPFTGYDLKKQFADSLTFPWSGNNNQIYRALVHLHEQGWVSKEVQYQEDRPPRKVYTITNKGREALRQWVLTAPELPETRHTFLAQLAWADQLTPAELDGLLEKYEYEVRMRLLMLQEQERRGVDRPARTPREAYLWRMIAEKWIAVHESELRWVQKLRQGLAAQPGSSPQREASAR